LSASVSLFEGLLEAAYALDELAAGRPPVHERLVAGALALDTLMRQGRLDRDLQDAALGLKTLATRGSLELDARGRARAARLAQAVRALAATFAPAPHVSMPSLSADCRAGLYRIVWETLGGESVHVFALAGSRDQAKALLRKTITLIGREPGEEPSLINLNSYRDLVKEGMSEDEDLRVFESGWYREDDELCPSWVQRPLFLTDDPTLVGKWVELQEELAAQRAREAIGRAGRRT
jgi:hypothetical protein